MAMFICILLALLSNGVLCETIGEVFEAMKSNWSINPSTKLRFMPHQKITCLKGIEKLPTSIEELDLMLNSVNSLNNVNFSHFANLKKINLYANQLVSIDVFSWGSSLEELNLGNNYLSNNLVGIEKLIQTKISFLSLEKNSITSIQNIDFTKLTMLKRLDLRGNSISNITGIHWPPSLHSLSLENNQITNLQNFIVSSNLRVVSMENNPLKSINGIVFNKKQFQAPAFIIKLPTKSWWWSWWWTDKYFSIDEIDMSWAKDITNVEFQDCKLQSLSFVWPPSVKTVNITQSSLINTDVKLLPSKLKVYNSAINPTPVSAPYLAVIPKQSQLVLIRMDIQNSKIIKSDDSKDSIEPTNKNAASENKDDTQKDLMELIHKNVSESKDDNHGKILNDAKQRNNNDPTQKDSMEPTNTNASQNKDDNHGIKKVNDVSSQMIKYPLFSLTVICALIVYVLS